MSIINDALKKASELKKKTLGGKKEPAPEYEIQGKKNPSSYLDSSVPQLTPEQQHKTELAKDTKKESGKKSIYRRILPLSIAMIVIIVAVWIFLFNDMAPIVEMKENVQEKIMPIVETISEKINNIDRFQLTGIAYEDNEPLAIINDSIYTVGEYVDGAEVISITESSVLLKRDNEEIRLRVK